MSRGHEWEGKILAVQPRILLNRSFDQRWEDYLGYTLVVEGAPDDRITVGISEADQRDHAFRAGDIVQGQATITADPDHDPATYSAGRTGRAGSVRSPSANTAWGAVSFFPWRVDVGRLYAVFDPWDVLIPCVSPGGTHPPGHPYLSSRLAGVPTGVTGRVAAERRRTQGRADPEGSTAQSPVGGPCRQCAK